MEQLWADVDAHLVAALHPDDRVIDEVLSAQQAAGLPAINVSPAQGRFLSLLTRAIGARKVLEIGTLGGYSTTWLARALPEGGRVITLEYSPRHAEVARANVDRAGVGESVDIRVGPALETLPQLESEAPFDLVFIDADKPNTPSYVEWAIKLGRSGTAVIVDNVVRSGEIADPASTDANVVAMRQTLDLIGRHQRLSAAGLQTVGAKGYDGFVLALID